MVAYNKTILAGNLTRDPELRYTTDGKPVCNFDIAVNHNYTNKKGEKKEEVLYIPVTVWGKQAESTAQYMKKGRAILVEGRLFQERWEDKDGNKKSKLKLNATIIQFLGNKKSEKEDAAEPETEKAQD